jgi:hypothetical protein
VRKMIENKLESGFGRHGRPTHGNAIFPLQRDGLTDQHVELRFVTHLS